MPVDLLETEDIFDIYGCEFLLNASHAHKRQLETDERDVVLFRVDEIHEKYVSSVRERVKAELIFCGVNEVEINEGFTIRSMVEKANDLLNDEIDKQTDNMMKGVGFNMMDMVLKARQQSGGTMDGVDQKKIQTYRLHAEEAEEKKDNSVQNHKDEGFFNNPKWQVIANAFIALEEANTTDDKIQSIDRLNDLQHNSFHILIDLQTGRMLEGNSKGSKKGDHNGAKKILDEVLDIKKGASSPKEFSGKMSSDIRKLVRKCA